MSGDANTTAAAGAASASAGPTTTERPEALVGAAFAGGLVLALILKKLGR